VPIRVGEIIEVKLKQQAVVSDAERAQVLGERAADTTSFFIIFVVILKFTILN